MRGDAGACARWLIRGDGGCCYGGEGLRGVEGGGERRDVPNGEHERCARPSLGAVLRAEVSAARTLAGAGDAFRHFQARPLRGGREGLRPESSEPGRPASGGFSAAGWSLRGHAGGSRWPGRRAGRTKAAGTGGDRTPRREGPGERRSRREGSALP